MVKVKAIGNTSGPRVPGGQVWESVEFLDQLEYGGEVIHIMGDVPRLCIRW